jgi:hypothetical protein
MAEAGTPESTMLSLMGHISRQMMEHYSHIRMAAKREAVESLSITVKTKTLPKTTGKEMDKVTAMEVVQ